MADDTTFHFPARPPRTRTALEPIYAPVRWLVALVVIGVLYYALLILYAFGGILVLVGLWLFDMIRHPFTPFGWLWTRQAMSDLRDWAFARRVPS